MAELTVGVLGLAGTIDVCIKGGRHLVRLCKDYRQAHSNIEEISLRIETCWYRVSDQLEITKEWEDSLTASQREMQRDILRVLQSTLDESILALSRVFRSPKLGIIDRLRFITLQKALKNVVEKLETWQKQFEPTWFQLIKTAPSGILGTLQGSTTGIARDNESLAFRRAFEEGQPMTIAEKTLEKYIKTKIPHCAGLVAMMPEGNKRHLIDLVSVDSVKVKDARRLAHRLRDASPITSGMMKCKGIVRQPKLDIVAFVFRVPDGIDTIRSLRDLLLSGLLPSSLTVRLQIARRLATAVYFVHLYGFIHKNISPETVLSLTNAEDADTSAVVCLIGFQVLRDAEGRTNTAGFGLRNTLYQHPSRHGVQKTGAYVIQHDIYSLGVCLLEIGIWESLLSLGPNGVARAAETLRAAQDHMPMAGPESDQKCLVAMSRSVLRETMGDKYGKVVETCLSCLDEGNLDFGDPQDFHDDDGDEIGVRYMEKVLESLNSIII